MLQEIRGNQNPKIKKARSLFLKKNRQKLNLFMVEGIKSVKDAITAGANIEMVFISESFEKETLDLSNFESYVLPDTLFNGISDTKAPQGIMAVIKMNKNLDLPDKKNGLYIYCDSVSDPGNLGTIIRTADAAGFDGIFLSEGCADLYSPKTIRSSMGSYFHIPIYENIKKEQLEKLKKNGFKIYCGALSKNTIMYTDADFCKPMIIVVGNEANGISEKILKIADECIKIPIFGKAESLNVGVAAAILMYEAKRQRNEKTVD